MELLLDILGYGIITIAIGIIVYAFVKLLTVGLEALTKNDD